MYILVSLAIFNCTIKSVGQCVSAGIVRDNLTIEQCQTLQKSYSDIATIEKNGKTFVCIKQS